MEGRKSPTIVSDEQSQALIRALENLCSKDKITIVQDHLRILNENLQNVRRVEELPIVERNIGLIQTYIEFATALQVYAAQSAIVNLELASDICELSIQLDGLTSKVRTLKRTFESAEDDRLEKLATMPMIKVEIKQEVKVKRTHSRMPSNYSRLTENLNPLEKAQKRLLRRLADVANDLIDQELLLPIIDKQQAEFSEKEINRFCSIDLEILCCKKEEEVEKLTIFFKEYQEWFKNNQALLIRFNKSLVLNNLVCSIVSMLIGKDMIKEYEALDKNTDEMRMRVMDSELSRPQINQIHRVILLEAKNLDKLYTERLRDIADKLKKEKEALAAEKKAADKALEDKSSKPSGKHERQRSKSQGKMPSFAKQVPAVELFRQARKSHSGRVIDRKNSARLPTIWREKGEKDEKKDKRQQRQTMAFPTGIKFE